MSVVESRTSLWEVLAGRAPGQPVGPADVDLWKAVAERLNPAKALPSLRQGIEEVSLTSLRGEPYVMLRSPDDGEASYLRLTPEEVELAHRMDGTRTVAALVGEFTRISGRLAPDQVLRLVADLAGNRMLDELPVDAFRPLEQVRTHSRPLPARLGRGLLNAARGRRMVLADIDRATALLYRAGGRLLFTRPAAALMVLVALAGMALFAWTWAGGGQSVFLVGGSYATGALVLLGLNVAALSAHELGHALAAKHAGRRVPAMGVLLYFGLPSVFVDTTDVWMAGRRARLLTSAAGPLAAVTLAGAVQLAALAYPALGPVAFKIAFVWYLNSLFNLNPLMALDGYYLFMDWLEIPNLRPRAMATLAGWVRRRRPRWSELDREGRLIATYAVLATVWLVVMLNLMVRMYRDRVGGVVVGLWHTGPAARVLLVAIGAGLVLPVVYGLAGLAARTWRRAGVRLRERRRTADLPRRLAALHATGLRGLPEAQLAALAVDATWVHPRTGEQVLAAGAAVDRVLVVVDGLLEGRRPGDPPGAVRARVGPGELVGAAPALAATPSTLSWTTAGTRLLALPARVFAAVVAPFVTTPPQTDRAEAEALLDDTPALAGLTEEQRLALLPHLRPVDLQPGRRVEVGAGQVAVVGSGLLETAGGELRRGQLVGPPSGDLPLLAAARTQARVWPLPALPGGLAGLLAAGGSAGTLGAPAPAMAGSAPGAGVHPSGGYPPLAARVAPPVAASDEVDRRLQRGLLILLVLLLLLALLTGRLAAMEPMPWTEMPADRVLLSVERGEVDAVVGGRQVLLRTGDRRYLSEADALEVRRRSVGRLTFRGGGEALLCPRTEATVGSLRSHGARPAQPAGELTLHRGALLADTRHETPALLPLQLAVDVRDRAVTNHGAALFAVLTGRFSPVEAAVGRVFLDGVLQPVTGDAVACPGGSGGAPDGPAIRLPLVAPAEVLVETAEATPAATPTAEPEPEAPVTPQGRTPRSTGAAGTTSPAGSPSPTSGPTPQATPTTSPTPTPGPTPTPTEPPLTPPSPQPSPTPSPTPTPTPSPDPDPDPDPGPGPDPEPDPGPSPEPEPTREPPREPAREPEPTQGSERSRDP